MDGLVNSQNPLRDDKITISDFRLNTERPFPELMWLKLMCGAKDKHRNWSKSVPTGIL